jgi:hypothetical protein
MLRLVDAIGGVDVVIFDNVMSLLTGVQRDEETWSAVQPLVQKLSERSIGQIWFRPHRPRQNAPIWRIDESVALRQRRRDDGTA